MARQPVVRFREERTAEFCCVVTKAWEKRTGYLQGLQPPEEMFHPEGIAKGSRDHSLYLWLVAWLSRSGKSANQVMRIAQQIMVETPELADPLRCPVISELPRTDPRRRLLIDAIPFAESDRGEAYNRLRWWDETMAVLRDQYEGDIRNLMLTQTARLQRGHVWAAREELIGRLCAMKGIGHKIAQLAIMWYQTVDWEDSPDDWALLQQVPAVAVDVWLLRLVRQCGCIAGYRSDHRDRVGRPVSDYLSRILWKQKLDHIAFGQGAWHIQARIHRRWQLNGDPVNQARLCYQGCPVQSLCYGDVPANAELYSRGSIGWKNVVPRPVLPTLFAAEDVQALVAVDGKRLRPRVIRVSASDTSVAHQLGFELDL